MIDASDRDRINRALEALARDRCWRTSVPHAGNGREKNRCAACLREFVEREIEYFERRAWRESKRQVLRTAIVYYCERCRCGEAITGESTTLGQKVFYHLGDDGKLVRCEASPLVALLGVH